MTEPRTPRPISTPNDNGRTPSGRSHSNHLKRGGYRDLVCLAVGIVGLGVVPATVSAHGEVGHGGASVAFPVVVGAPVVAGVLGGVITIKSGSHLLPNTSSQRMRIGFGLLLIALAGTFAISALARSPLLCIVCGSVGALTTVWVDRREKSNQRQYGHHADLTLGGVCVHRVLEGVILGALSITSALIGVVGVVVVASHAALETAVVGGLYHPHRLQAFGAITLIQFGYIVGALVGVVAGASVPVSVQTALLGLLAGILLIVGIGEARPTQRVNTSLQSY